MFAYGSQNAYIYILIIKYKTMKTLNIVTRFTFTLLGLLAILTGIINGNWALFFIAAFLLFMAYLAHKDIRDPQF